MRRICVGMMLMGAVAGVCGAAEFDVPVIPPGEVVYERGYPKIPEAVQAEVDKREAEWTRLDVEAFEKAKPEIERWEKLGRPFVKVAREPSDMPKGEIPAFPGAEGGAMYTMGGRGGKVFVVTSLADSGPGTLREAAEAGGPRMVVFNVAGVIKLERPLNIRAPYITIAGQSAPGDGVCVAGRSVHMLTHDVVIRHMRFRRGSTDVTDRDDALSGDAIGNIMIDHVSASWGLDETLSCYRQSYYPNWPSKEGRQNFSTQNVTVQWCIVTEALDTYHHSFGSTLGGRNNAVHHNLYADNAGRNASMGGGGGFNWVNNVIFNWRHRTLDGGGSPGNAINNYYRSGPATNAGELQHRIVKPQGRVGKWFVSGNVVAGHEDVTRDNWLGVTMDAPDAPSTQPGAAPPRPVETLEAFRARIRSDAPAPMPVVTVQKAEEAYEAVLTQAGATLPKRDAVDERAVRQTRSGEVEYKAGKGIITDVSQVGGYPAYTGEPVKYAMNDGMPEWWKVKYKLDVSDKELAGKDGDGDGYTTIEEYLNGTDPTVGVDYRKLENNRNGLSAEEGGRLLRGG